MPRPNIAAFNPAGKSGKISHIDMYMYIYIHRYDVYICIQVLNIHNTYLQILHHKYVIICILYDENPKLVMLASKCVCISQHLQYQMIDRRHSYKYRTWCCTMRTVWYLMCWLHVKPIGSSTDVHQTFCCFSQISVLAKTSSLHLSHLPLQSLKISIALFHTLDATRTWLASCWW